MSKTKITREQDLLRGWEKLQEIKAMFTLGRWESVVAKVKEQQDENNQLKADYTEIQQLRDAELSHIYRLEETLTLCRDLLESNPHIGPQGLGLHCMVVDILDEPCEQSLNHVKAEGVELLRD